MSEDILNLISYDDIYGKLDGLETSFPENRSEILVNVDREKAGLYKLNTRLIGNTIRTAINGTEASKYRDGKDEYDIIVRLREEDRKDISSLGGLEIKADKNQFVPISEIASWEITEGLGGIRHKDSKRLFTISA